MGYKNNLLYRVSHKSLYNFKNLAKIHFSLYICNCKCVSLRNTQSFFPDKNIGISCTGYVKIIKCSKLACFTKKNVGAWNRYCVNDECIVISQKELIVTVYIMLVSGLLIRPIVPILRICVNIRDFRFSVPIHLSVIFLWILSFIWELSFKNWSIS